MKAALKARAAKAAAVKAKQAATALGTIKRPAAAAKGRPRKRPSSGSLEPPTDHNVDLGELLKASVVKSATSLGAFTTKASAMGKKQAMAAELSEEEIKACGASAYATARDFYLRYRKK